MNSGWERTAGLDVVHHGVDIAAAVRKRRVHKAEVGQTDHPVALARTDAVFVLLDSRAQASPARPDRPRTRMYAYSSVDSSCVLARGSLARHVVHIVVNHDQVVARVAVLLDHLLVQAVEQLLVRQLAVLERQQVCSGARCRCSLRSNSSSSRFAPSVPLNVFFAISRYL